MNKNNVYCSIEEALQIIRNKELIIIQDNKDRENEGDLYIPAALVEEKHINFMITHGKGLLCVPITKQRAAQLALSPMVSETENEEYTQCKFTISVDARRGIGSGISVSDRTETVRLLANAATKRNDLVRPGHIFPLTADPAGLRARKGHTEAAVEIAKLLHLDPSGVICEIIGDNGEMLAGKALEAYAEQHGLKIITIDALAQYCKERSDVTVLSSAVLPTKYGDFQCSIYHVDGSPNEEIVLTYGDISEGNIPTRIHSECITSEVFGSLKCDCDSQLAKSMSYIHEKGRGIILYLRQEGRGIGLVEKIKAYRLQEQGMNTLEANIALGHGADTRDYTNAVKILESLGVTSIELLTNNPQKVSAFGDSRIEVKRVRLEVEPTKENANYLQVKKDVFGHILDLPSQRQTDMKQDEVYMQRAINLAKKAKNHTFPNPLVGAVFVKDGEIIAEGYHEVFGGYHAEKSAVISSKANLEGSTLYVNLEPCCHHGKTPPCTDILIETGIRRVVCAQKDPHEKVAGKGIELLKSHGIDVTVGVLEKEAEKINEHFNYFHREGKPFISMKFASSLDGKIATHSNHSKWITNDRAKTYARDLRAQHQAILVGKHTLLADNPHLGVRIDSYKDPLRIVIDAKLEVPSSLHVFRDKNVLLFTSLDAPQRRKDVFRQLGFEIIELSGQELSYHEIIGCLARKGIISLYVEGGGETNGRIVDAGMVDKVYAFHAPSIIGGSNAVTAVGAHGFSRVEHSLQLQDVEYEELEGNFLTVGYVGKH